VREDELRALREKRMSQITELRTFNEAAQKRAGENGGAMSADDEAEWQKRETELLETNKRLEMETRTEHAARFNPDATEGLPKAGGPVTFEEFRSGGEAHKLHGAQITRKQLDDAEYREASYTYLTRGRDGMDYEEYRVLSKGASGGGFFVPTDLADSIIRALRFLPGGVSSLARTVNTSTGETINLPLNLTHGSASWIAESGTYTPSDETITNATISAYKAGSKMIVSEELLTDTAFDLSGFISSEFGERIGSLAEAAYIAGDGSGKPTGILDAASAVTISTLPAGYVTTVAWAGLATAIYSDAGGGLAVGEADRNPGLDWRTAVRRVDRRRVARPDGWGADLRAPEPRRCRGIRQVGDRR
jgi:HK97 family phage major capsid protein